MMVWDDLRIVLALARRGTLAAAAAELHVNATTVGRRLNTLEEAIHVKLFDRLPDRYVLTSAGDALVTHAERMEQEVFAIERGIAGADTRVDGIVKLSTTEMIATRFVAPHLVKLRDAHPQLMLLIHCSNTHVNLSRREADIALRLARPHEPDVIARPISRVLMSLYASPVYLASRQQLPPPGESLIGHDLLMFAESRAFAIENDWLSAHTQGTRVVLRSDSVSSIYSATVAGLGIALLPRRVADGDSQLVCVREAEGLEPRTIWLAVHRDLAKNPRVRAVITFLREVVSSQKLDENEGFDDVYPKNTA